MNHLILLYDSSVPSFCYYKSYDKREKMSLETLRKVILFAQKEGMTINVIAGGEALPEEFRKELDNILHVVIAPWTYPHDDVNDVSVVDWSPSFDASVIPDNPDKDLILRLPVQGLSALASTVKILRFKGRRVNVTLLDVNRYREEDFKLYEQQLQGLDNLENLEINVLTDRLVLQGMNNCGAGDSSITVAPDGRLYVCPGFYYDDEDACGDIENGLCLPNRHLYRIENAPICRICDAWQCRRCIWLNLRATGEVNTPSRGQCVASHKERHASVLLSAKTNTPLEDVPYEDPFDTIRI